MTNVVKRMVGIIEAIPISGNAFPLREFESKIKCVLRLSNFFSIFVHRNFSVSPNMGWPLWEVFAFTRVLLLKWTELS